MHLEETFLQSYLKNCASVPRSKAVLNAEGGHTKNVFDLFNKKV